MTSPATAARSPTRRRGWPSCAGSTPYVEAQARERLHYVMPGETSYVVLEADDAPSPDGAVEPEKAAAARSPWFTDLWRSVEVAGGTQKPTR